MTGCFPSKSGLSGYKSSPINRYDLVHEILVLIAYVSYEDLDSNSLAFVT